jgi:ParB family transcriptional regulator, chromosome partitioning protein
LIVELALDELEFNEFNPRLTYSESSVENMAKSMSIYGQLAPVKVRAGSNGKYEVVFGHRRVSAARKMGWTTIKAEIAKLSNEQMIQEAIVENLERKDFSDFEKAVAFERLHA